MLFLYARGNDEKICLQEYLKAKTSVQLLWPANHEKGQTSRKVVDACIYIRLMHEDYSLEGGEEHRGNEGAVFGRSLWRLQSGIDCLNRSVAFDS
jgi:hypothetical protein